MHKPSLARLKTANHFVPLITVIVVAITFVCYWTAIRFFHGYQAGFGVTIELGSEQEMVGFGLTLFLSLAFDVLIDSVFGMHKFWPLLLVSVAIGLILGVMFVKAENTQYQESSQRFERWLAIVSHYAAKVLAVFLIPLLLFVSLSQAAYEQAKDYALEKLNQLAEQGCDKPPGEDWKSCVSIQHHLPDLSNPLVGYLVSQDKQNIAIFLPSSRELKILPRTESTVITKTFLVKKIGVENSVRQLGEKGS